MRTVYINNQYLPENEAQVSIFDRGFLFGDAIYEVTAVIDGKLIEFDAHLARLKRSLAEIDMEMPASREALLEMHRELVHANGLVEGLIYMQVTRGAADRDFLMPSSPILQTVIAFTQSKILVDTASAKKGMNVGLVEDLRWQRSDIKTTQLLYSSLMKSRAHKDGFDDVWLTRDGFITEGSSNNAYIVTANGEIITRHLNTEILHGITRKSVLEAAQKLGLKFVERAFSVEEAKNASEAFLTSAGTFVTPVVTMDGQNIGDGNPGQISKALREAYLKDAIAGAI